MVILSIIGGHDREAVASFVNPLIIAGGVTEVRICKFGEEANIQMLVRELNLINQTDKICSVRVENLICRDGEFAEVVIFLNSSYKSNKEFCKMSKSLLKVFTNEVEKSEVENLNVLFSDNTRGLLQKNILDKLVKQTTRKFNILSVALSSIHQISKSFNAGDSEDKLRLYPKVDGSVFSYDPSESLSETTLAALNIELKPKLSSAEKLFTNQTAKVYPNLEGTVLSRFVMVYIQSGWVIACRDDGLYSRLPTRSEMLTYDLDHGDVAVFLPTEGDGIGVQDKLPVLVRKHIKDTSEYMKLQVDEGCD